MIDQFRPLTQVEINEKKPLYIKFGKYALKYNLWSANNVAKFWEIKAALDIRAKGIEEKPEGSTEISLSIYGDIVRLLWHCSELVRIKNNKEKKVNNRLVIWRQSGKYWKWMMDHVDVILDQFDTVCAYQSRLFFLLRHVLQMSPIQEQGYIKIGLEPTQKAMIRGPKHGFLSQVSANSKKRKLSTN